ncbi:hypothetical protein DPMN_189937 [Dreissena polymorpha]|uniref:Uncharacterized protein n=1 Tax=Dreissena polymorpha TaxID=45954 RepID=A0A9D4ICN2_DREPO|nr:hypothetical protein DPMN_189937 [Dreissena polymorpha]
MSEDVHNVLMTMDALHRCKSDFSNVIKNRLPGQRGGQSKADISNSCSSSIGCQQLLVNVSGNGHVRLTTQEFPRTCDGDCSVS